MEFLGTKVDYGTGDAIYWLSVRENADGMDGAEEAGSETQRFETSRRMVFDNLGVGMTRQRQ